MSDSQQQMCIYMPSIFWHDRQGILSIDVLQQQSATPDDVPIYKIATASMQKEIRLWNFRFEPTQALTTKPKSAIATDEPPKVTPVPVFAPKVKAESKREEKNLEERTKKLQLEEDDENDIICLDQEKENKQKESEGGKDEELMDLEVVEMELAKAQQQRTVAPQSLSVEFLANLEEHRFTTNIVRFSPNGKYLASGDANGCLIVWTLASEQKADEKMEIDNNGKAEEKSNGEQQQKKRGDPEMDIPSNKENWVRTFRTSMAHHDGDITGLCFSPDSQLIASCSMTDSVALNRADTGKRLWFKRGYRHFANGIVWDPRGKYIITLSTDRRMDVLETQRGTVLRSCHQVELPTTRLYSNGMEISQQVYKLFHDDQLCAFQRGVDFSPCGGVVLAPAVHLEVGVKNIYGIYAFRRADLNQCRPTALFPTLRPTIQVKCSPVLYNLEEGANFLGLPHRLIFAVLCRDSVLLYNSQCESPFAYLENLHYDKLTSISWTPDGRILVVSSLEGFNSFISMDVKKLGTPCEIQPNFLAFQQQQQVENTQKTPIKEDNGGNGVDGSRVATPEVSTPKANTQLPPPPYVSLLDSPKLVPPKRIRPKKVQNTPQELKTPKQQAEKRDEPMPHTDQSPKTIVPKKKPRKVALMTLEQAEAQPSNEK